MHERLVVSVGGREVVEVQLLVLQDCRSDGGQPSTELAAVVERTLALLGRDSSVGSGERHGSNVVVRVVRSSHIRCADIYLSILWSCMTSSNQL